MIEYPKIETLFHRDDKTHKVTGKIRCPEYENIKLWELTEKIHGMNIRITLLKDGSMRFDGREENSQMPSDLLNKFMNIFTAEKMKRVLWGNGKPVEVTIFGEGYGKNIHDYGKHYNSEVQLRLFDVHFGERETDDGQIVPPIWLESENVKDIAGKFSVKTVPIYQELSTLEDAISLVKDRTESIVAATENNVQVPFEGIVARSKPLMLNRKGERIIWKLKIKDFPQ